MKSTVTILVVDVVLACGVAATADFTPINDASSGSEVDLWEALDLVARDPGGSFSWTSTAYLNSGADGRRVDDSSDQVWMDVGTASHAGYVVSVSMSALFWGGMANPSDTLGQELVFDDSAYDGTVEISTAPPVDDFGDAGTFEPGGFGIFLFGDGSSSRPTAWSLQTLNTPFGDGELDRVTTVNVTGMDIYFWDGADYSLYKEDAPPNSYILCFDPGSDHDYQDMIVYIEGAVPQSPCDDDLDCDDGYTCTLDSCGPTGVCEYEYVPAGTVCRPSAGVCDVEEVCPGDAPSCPVDLKLTDECRASEGVCDPAEFCDGASNDCPVDVKSTDECRASEGVCDPAEFCDGASNDCPIDFKSTDECRASGGVCDPAEFCDGVSDNCPVDLKSTDECRASEGVCDPAEFCDGVSDNCPVDLKSTDECRASEGVCDPAEFCDGVNDDCPVDLKSTDECRASTGVCDPAEFCDGASSDCPADEYSPEGTACPDDGDECTNDVCDGIGVDCTHPNHGMCGACCLPDKTCLFDVLSGTCQGQDGTFLGSGSVCLGDSDGDGYDDQCDECPGVNDDLFPECQEAIPTVSWWGLLVLALLLMVVGKLRFGVGRSETA